MDSINLDVLQCTFAHKPLLVGGKAMEYYGLRKAGADIDFVLHEHDHAVMRRQYPNNIKDLYGDIGICEFGFEMWNQICTFDYHYLGQNAVEESSLLVISLERLLFLKALAMGIPKSRADLEMVVDLVLRRAYGKA